MAETKKILFVEDEIAMLNALANKFRQEDFAVFTASDGEEGVKLALKEKPDLLMLDIIMPKLDGIGVIKKVRENAKWGKDVPIIMLTNLSDPEHVSEAAKYGVYDFLVKTDWRLDEVVQMVKTKLGI
jgi:DNA-binding response OmpR family regulator